MIFGWDISTSIIGVTALDKSGSFLGCEHLDLRKVEGGLLAKGDSSEHFVLSTIGKYGIHGGNTHYVEDRLGGFSAGKTMLQTLMTLASFNTLISWLIHCTDKDVVHIHPSTVKSIMRKEGLLIPKGGDKKKLTLDFVTKTVPGWKVDLNRNDNPQPWNYDRADSYIVARAGYLRNYLNQDAQGKKDPGPTGRSRAGEDPER